MSLNIFNLPHFAKLTKSQYNNLQEYDEKTFYFITDTGELYVGSIQISSPPRDPAVRFESRPGSLSYFSLTDVVSGKPNSFSIFVGEPDIMWNTNFPFVADSWVKTIVVANVDHDPTTINDGTIILENNVRNKYKTLPYSVQWVPNSIYIRVFFQLLDGSYWRMDLSGASPYAYVNFISVESLDDYMDALRSGDIDSLKHLYPKGSTLNFVQHSNFSSMTWMIGGYDYTGWNSTVQEYCCNDENAQHNVILVPVIAPSLSNGSHVFTPYDPLEKTSAVSVDTEFNSSKTYYTNSTCTSVYNQSSAGAGDTPASLGLYEKGRITGTAGYSRYSMSFLRRWLNAEGPNWYTPLDIFEPDSVDFANTYEGFLGGFTNDIRQYIHRVNQRYRLPTNVNQYDICQDMIWIPAEEQIFTVTGKTQYMIPIFDGMTNANKRFYSAAGVACYSYTGTPVSGSTTSVVNLGLNGESSSSGKLQGGGQMKDVSMPIMCLA